MTQTSAGTNVRFGPFDVDLATGELRKHGVRLRLAGQPFEILTMLLERPGELVTREEIRAKLWQAETFVDFDHSLNAAVSKLREALGDSADNPRYIETLPRRGYRMMAPVEPAKGAAISAAAQRGTAAEGTSAISSRARASRIWLVSSALALIAVVLLLAFGNRLGNVARSWGAPPAATGAIRSVAVLPFENLSKDPQEDYFADGMTEELITHLARFGALRVTSRTSVMQFKGARQPLKEIAAALGVDAIIEGTVRRENGRVRISAQLIHAAGDRHLWAAIYERDLRNVLDLQNELAGVIAQQVQVQTSPQERAWTAHAPPLDLDAYQLYLRGKHALEGNTPAIKRTASAYFQQAVDKDPAFAPAWTALAEHALFQAPPRTHMPRARAAARRALALNPNLADAHYALGLTQTMWEWDFAAGEKSFRRALELNPSHAQARHRYAYNLNAQGRLDEAIAQLTRAQAIDPLSDEITTYLGRTYFFARRYEQAEREFQRAIALNPSRFFSHFFRAILHEHQGDYGVAVDEFVKAYRINGAMPEMAERAQEYYRQRGYEAVQRTRIKLVTAASDPAGLGSSALALMHVRLGEKEKALEWLQRSFESHAGDLIYLNVDPQYDPIRNDPRFQELVRRVGLPAAPPQKSAAAKAPAPAK